MSRKKTLAIDFDGVIHAYTKGWQGGVIYDSPVEGALESMEKLRRFYDIYIFTTRADTPEGRIAIREWVSVEQQRLGLPPFAYEVTNEKRPAIVYLDDRAVRFTSWADFRKLYD